jgi:hypothetical protein
MRNAISQPRLGARLHSPDPAVNTARPTWKTRRRPTRSAVAPDSISRLARTSTYPSMVHCNPGHRRVQVPADGRQRDVDDRAVQAHDEQARTADDKHEQTSTATELWQWYHPGLAGENVIVSLQLTICTSHTAQDQTV